MAVVDSTTSGDLGSILKMLGDKKMADNLFGDNSGSGLIGGLILGSLLRNNGNLLGSNGVDGNVVTAADRAAIDSAVASALASANQNNNNSMLLLKDIQDTGQDVVSAVNAGNIGLLNAVNSGNQTALIQQLQNQIANLQGQKDLGMAIATSTANTINEIHEANETVTSQLNTINTNMLAGFNSISRDISNDGDKTRALITQTTINELNNQLADLRTQQAVGRGGVEVTNNINQNQFQQQQQQQSILQSNLLGELVREMQRNSQAVVNMGVMSGNAGRQNAQNVAV
mgnify:CR=1 FL=1